MGVLHTTYKGKRGEKRRNAESGSNGGEGVGGFQRVHLAWSILGHMEEIPLAHFPFQLIPRGTRTIRSLVTAVVGIWYRCHLRCSRDPTQPTRSIDGGILGAINLSIMEQTHWLGSQPKSINIPRFIDSRSPFPQVHPTTPTCRHQVAARAICHCVGMLRPLSDFESYRYVCNSTCSSSTNAIPEVCRGTSVGVVRCSCCGRWLRCSHHSRVVRCDISIGISHIGVMIVTRGAASAPSSFRSSFNIHCDNPNTIFCLQYDKYANRKDKMCEQRPPGCPVTPPGTRAEVYCVVSPVKYQMVCNPLPSCNKPMRI